MWEVRKERRRWEKDERFQVIGKMKVTIEIVVNSTIVLVILSSLQKATDSPMAAALENMKQLQDVPGMSI